MKILVPIPKTDFDPTEAGVPWKILTEKSIQIIFATPDGKPAQADPRMVTGQGLGIWSQLLKADNHDLEAYRKMTRSHEFQNPIAWSEAKEKDYVGIILPGGHAPGMKEYLESQVLQNLIAEFFLEKKLLAAICHGVVLAARSQQPDGKSILYNHKATALLRTQELTAWSLTCLWLKNYYRTYSETVQSEVTRSLASPRDFIKGPLPLRRDSPENTNAGFVVEDRNLITARWPGDAHRFGESVARYLIKNS